MRRHLIAGGGESEFLFVYSRIQLLVRFHLLQLQLQCNILIATLSSAFSNGKTLDPN